MAIYNKPRRPQVRRTLLALALGFALAHPALAQQSAGSIFGQASGKVTIENLDTGFSREVEADAAGRFRFTALPTGKYKVSSGGSEKTVTVNAGIGSEVQFAAEAATLDSIVVTGSGAVNPIDVSSVESVTVLTAEQVNTLPVARDVTSVALLAPGTTKGDTAFGNLASFGGSSVAENAYFVNGFNVTNIFKGVAYAQLPFEAIAETQVKTGGYGAEFGRSTGGVVNIVTKRGSNEWKGGGSLYYAPDSLLSDNPNTYDRDGELYNRNDNESNTALTYAGYVSGPIVKDRLFFYALYQERNAQTDRSLSRSFGQYYKYDDKDPLWLTKLDWNITDNQIVEFTGFSDKRTSDVKVLNHDDAQGAGTPRGNLRLKEGGDNYVAKYTGYFGNDFTLSALYGYGKYQRYGAGTGATGATCPLVIDVRTGVDHVSGCWVDDNGLAERLDSGDRRKQFRVDGEWTVGDHSIGFGYDREDWNTVGGSEYVGGQYYRYIDATPGGVAPNGAAIPDGVTQIVRRRVLRNGGSVDITQGALYVQDDWKVNDNLLVYGGLRNEAFDNKNPAGETFAKLSTQIAPRLGFSWDMNGDSSRKVFGSLGRYHLPIAANTNVRASGGEIDYAEYYTFTGIDPVTGAPTIGQQLGGRTYTSNGVIPNPRSVADRNLKSMYQDELILGFQQQLANNWSVGVRGIHRNLGSAIDDFCSGLPFERWAERNNVEFDDHNIPACVVFNPGEDVSVDVDIDNDGDLDRVDLSAADLRFEKAKRKYNALELFFERGWDDKWFLQGSYTWAHSYGNTEGYVKSDIGQDDAGVTQDFDFPQLMTGAYGNLPNDRRHTFKVFGAYKPAEEWTLGGNFLLQSGRPKNCLGFYPDPDDPELDPAALNYEAAFFYCNGELTPRGSRGTTPWITNFDVNVEYRPKFADGRLALKLDVFNLFNKHTITSVNDTGEDAPGIVSSTYGIPLSFQAPRSARFSVRYDF